MPMGRYYVGAYRTGGTGKRKYTRRKTAVLTAAPRSRNIFVGRSAINQAYYKGLIHSFSRSTEGVFNAHNHNNWAVAPAADTVDNTQMVWTSQATPSIGYGAIGFRLKDLASESEFNNLFDHFRLNAVKLTFSFLYDNATIGGTLKAPQLYIVKDYDDIAVPASVGELIQYANCKQVQVYNKSKGVVNVYLQPRVMNTTTSEQQPRGRRPWIDMASSNSVTYNGVKFALVNRDSASVKIYIRAKYYFQCKGQR